MWIDGLVRRNQDQPTGISNPVTCNFTVLAEHLLNPHGQGNGLSRPDHWAQGEDGTCDCPRVSAEVTVSNVLDKTPVVRLPSNQGGIAEEMETVP